MDFSPNLNLPFLLPSQAQKHVTANQVFQAMDVLVQASVSSRSMTAPPASPAEGDRYIPASGATGAWSGWDEQLTSFQDGGWVTYPPRAGWIVWVEDESQSIAFDGAAWMVPGLATSPETLGVNASADMVNRLVVKSQASLFDHDGSDHRLKLNKATSSDTASLIFQDNYAGFVELGLTGKNDLSIKVSNDGTNFVEAMTIQGADGYVGIGTETPNSQLHMRQDFDARLTIDTITGSSGGGFDIINSADGQNWRVTGHANLFKIRDHTAGLNKLTFHSGAQGEVYIENCGNVGINTLSPTASLHVAGSLRVGSYTISALPSPATVGAGTIAFVSDAPGGGRLGYCDGTNWRSCVDASILA